MARQSSIGKEGDNGEEGGVAHYTGSGRNIPNVPES